MQWTFWQLVFFQSKVNGGHYKGDSLPQHRWSWPSNTWFQLRREKLKGTPLEEVQEEYMERRDDELCF